jgi:thiamine-monophosphate kinase
VEIPQMPFRFKSIAMKFTPISEIGRQGLINRIRKTVVSNNENLKVGIGDDAAVYAPNPSSDQLITSETLIEGVDFDLSFHPLSHLGFKLVTVGVSDIVAMGGKPDVITVNFGLTTKCSVEMVDGIAEGIQKACEYYGCTLVGGDLRSSIQAIVLGITVIGSVPKGKSVLRRTAKEGDAICVSGQLGSALAGLKILLREKKFWQDHPDADEPSLEAWADVVAKQLLPKARTDLVDLMLSHSIKPNAMGDISKGLLNEIADICEQSKTGAYIYEAAIPITDMTKDAADEMGEIAVSYALQGGDDYEIIFTLAEENVDKAFEILKDITVIGMVRPQSEGIQIQKFSGDVWEVDTEQIR